MNKIITIIITLFFITSIASADEIEEILKEYPRMNVGILVENLKTGKEIYSLNPKKLRVAASVTKAFTAYAALEYLGKDFQYSTKILENDKDLYFKFSGDPSFTKKNLINLISKLKTKSISRNIIIDDFAFDQEYLGPGWAWDDSKFCFSAPISAIIINENCFSSILKPNGKITSSKIHAKFNNNLIARKDARCLPKLYARSDNSYDLNGCLNSIGPDIRLNIAYQNPRKMISSVIKDILKKQKIKFNGKIIFKEAPKQSKVLAQHKSAPLSQLLKKMMKESNNLYAESFLKTIDNNLHKTPGSFSQGTAMVKSLGDFKEARIVDGSGTSRYNAIAPDQLIELFTKAYKSKNWPYFYSSLAVSSIDGSLEKKFTDHKHLKGQIFAKTGNMSGVKNLVGYYKDKIFVIMINNYNCSAKEINKVEEEILSILLKK
jgi:serine-type D-Ala-D-Ala carboxypeptidase/endopeptidase (penicillin-binding protein 4)